MSIDLVVLVKSIVLVPITLLPILNPIAVAPIFLSMTGPMEQRMANKLAQKIAMNCFILIVITLFIGSYVLDFFGISLPIVRIAGGIVVSATGLKLLNDQGQDNLRNSVAESANRWTIDEINRHSFYPFSFPLTVGPGAIATTIALGTQLLATKLQSKPIDWVIASLFACIGAFITCIAVFISYRYAHKLQVILGDVGTTVLMRLSAFILLCIGLAIGWAGVSELALEIKNT